VTDRPRRSPPATAPPLPRCYSVVAGEPSGRESNRLANSFSFSCCWSQGKEEDIICNRQREVNGHTVTNEILWQCLLLPFHAMRLNASWRGEGQGDRECGGVSFSFPVL